MSLPDISGMDALIKIGSIQGSSTGIGGSSGFGGGTENTENNGAPGFVGSSN